MHIEVRRTRSGRAVRPPPTTKQTAKKTRKKMVLVEVEVSDEDEEAHAQSQADKAASDVTDANKKQDESEETDINSLNDTDNSQTQVVFNDTSDLEMVNDNNETSEIMDTTKVSFVQDGLKLDEPNEEELLRESPTNIEEQCNKIRVRSDSSLFNNDKPEEQMNKEEEQPMETDNVDLQENHQAIQNGDSKDLDPDVKDSQSSEEQCEEDSSKPENKAVSVAKR